MDKYQASQTHAHARTYAHTRTYSRVHVYIPSRSECHDFLMTFKELFSIFKDLIPPAKMPEAGDGKTRGNEKNEEGFFFNSQSNFMFFK